MRGKQLHGTLFIFIHIPVVCLVLLSGSTARAQDGSGDFLAQARQAFKKRHIPAQAIKALDFYEKAIDAKASYDALWEGARAAAEVGQNAWKNSSSNKRQGLYKKGLGWAKKAVALDPNRAEGHFFQAVLLGLHAQERTFLHQMSSARDVRRAAERALKLNPNIECAGPLRLLGLYYMRLPEAFGGDDQRACKLLEKALKSCPNSADIHCDLAECYTEIDQDSKAKKHAQWVLDHPPRKAADRRGYKSLKVQAQEILQDLD